MTKHIVGLIIFTLIVGTSAIIAGLFGYVTTSEKTSVQTYNEDYRSYKKKRKKRCRKHRKPRPKEVSAMVSQAVFDETNKNLTTEIAFENFFESEGEIDLHFFVQDGFGIQYLKRETIKVSSYENVYENSFGWLNRLESRENLYVVAKFKPDVESDYSMEFFDGKNATPVLVKAAE